MEIKINYDNCLTNVVCSIQKYFNVEYKHKTNKQLDEILERKQPSNVVLVLFDGMGANIIQRNLKEDDFFNKHMLTKITSVFPPTTTAATTSVACGLYPSEHCWLGWNTYLSNIDKTITLFVENEKGKTGPCKQFVDNFDSIAYKSVTSQIKDKGYEAVNVSNFGDIGFDSLDEMLDIIKQQCEKEGKKFIYAYDTEPDTTMHKYGPDSEESVSLIKERNDKVEKMCSQLNDSVVIVVADHGHTIVKDIFLEDYPEIIKMLERTTSIETRACSFKVKDGYQQQFKKLFNELFSNYFLLLDKDEVIESGLFGPTENYHPLFKDAIGDFVAVATSNRTLVYGDYPLYSHHAGMTDDEVYVPLIVYESL